MAKIVVIGCGNVGLSYVKHLTGMTYLPLDISLIDLDTKKIEGEILDLEQGLTLYEKNVSLKKGDYEDCKDADLVVLTAGLPQTTEDRMKDLEGANKIISSIVKQVMEYDFQGIFLVASNPVDVMSELVAHYASYPYEKVIGTGCMLDTARLKSLLLPKLFVRPLDIEVYVLGEHGNSQFVSWNNANIGLQNLKTLLTDEEKNELEEVTRKMGGSIISRKGYTCDGVALCLVKLTEAVLLDEKGIYCVSHYNRDYDVYLSTPAIIGKGGIDGEIEMKKTEEEEEKLKHSARVIQDAVNEILPVELY